MEAINFNFWFTLIVLLCANLNISEGADPTDISRLRGNILRNYDIHSRPTLQHNTSTFVDLYFYNNGFEFDEQKGFFTLHAAVYFEWQDDHVKWNPADYGNLTMITFYPTEIWRPDIQAENTIDKSEIDHFYNTLIMAYNTSFVYWIPPAKFKVGCVTDFYRWPYDLQQCTIKLSSWTHDGSEIYLSVNENHTQMVDSSEWHEMLKNREWRQVNNQIQRYINHHDCCPGVPFIDVQITITIERRSSVHTAAVIVVAFGIAVAVLISFWLNPNEKERVPVILVSLLLNSLYLNQIYSIIPPNGSRTPWTIGYFRDSLLMILFALAWTIGMRRIANAKRDSQVPLPPWLSSFLEGCVAKVLCLNPRPTMAENTPKNTNGLEQMDDGDELVKRENFAREDWGWFANILDRIVFLFYLVVYTCFILTF